MLDGPLAVNAVRADGVDGLGPGWLAGNNDWVAKDPNLDRMGVNARLFENVDLDQIKIRRFDGKDTWKFLE